MCSSGDGYRILCNVAFDKGLSGFFTEAPEQVRDLKADRYGIRTFVEMDSIPIKFEIVHEDRIQLSGEMSPDWGIPVLCRADMYPEQLLANADRYSDISAAGRDIIDLAMMLQGWGDIPEAAWMKVKKAYGDSAEKAFNKAIELISRPAHLSACLKKLHMDEYLADRIILALGADALDAIKSS